MNVFTKVLLAFPLFFLTLIASAQPAAWQSRGVGGGGSLFYPTINPANDNEFYITCDMSQLFHSIDYGATYTQVPFTQLQVGNISTYEYTNNNAIAYCIANDGNINYGVRTVNGGSSWAALPGNPFIGEDVYAVKADYAKPGRLIMGFYDALFISNDTGKTFSLIRTAANSGVGISLAGVFFDGDNIFIGTNEGLLISADGGLSFTKPTTTGMPATQAIFSFAGAKAGGITRFYCVAADAADIYNGIFPWDYYGFAKGVYTMDAGTNAWVPKMNGINIASDFVMYVGMARNDINTAYLGGSDDNTGGNTVIKTTDAGANWNKVFLTTNNQNIRTGWSGQGGDRGWGYGETCFGISVAPNNSNKVIFGDYGFVHTTSDGGANWRQAYVNTGNEHAANAPTPAKRYYQSIGLENTTSWQVHWQDANNMFAGFSDINGIRSTDGGLSWGFDYTGHNVNSMYRIAKHVTNSTMFAATSGVHDMYQSTRLQDNLLDATDAGGKIIYSSTNGASWQLLHQFNHPVFWLATDPSNTNRMYASVIHYGSGAGQGGIWMTNDLNNLGLSTWTKLANPPRTEGHPAAIVVLNDGKMVCTFSGRRTAAGAFTASSGVYLYDPVANSWLDRSHADMQYWTKDIVIDPTDATQSTWYVAVFSGWGGAPNGKGGLFKTTNRGVSWVKLTGSQFDRVTSITFNPTMTSQAYLTTETQGLWMSNNMNAATPAWSLVDNYVFRQPERVFFNPFNINEIWVTSFGNGLKAGLISGPLPVKLISFTGNRDGTFSHLNWITANESGIEKYQLQRSFDAIHFNNIQSIQSSGAGGQRYSATDTVTAAEVYYRLLTKNLQAGDQYSHIISFRAKRNGNVRLMSNPVKDNIVVQVEAGTRSKALILVTTVSGKKILERKLTVEPGSNMLSVPLPDGLSNGIYILQVQEPGNSTSYRLLLSR